MTVPNSVACTRANIEVIWIMDWSGRRRWWP